MTRMAGQRLIDSASKLGAEDRAMLSLMINHGFDDETIASAINADPAMIVTRHEQLIVSLSSVLGLPPSMVSDAVEELRESAREGVAAHGTAPDNEHSDPPASPPPVEAAQAEAAPAAPAAPTGPATQAAPTTPDRRRRRRAFAAGLGLIVIVAVLVITLSTGSGGHHKAAPKPVAASPLHGSATFAGLPGGPTGVSGSVELEGTSKRPLLAVTVSGLPPPGNGYYELWLYNSIIDSVPLPRLSASSSRLVVSLPAGFRRYQWLDISLQPPGTVNHSGESILRTAVPQ
jgi:hypothetical protein